MRAPMWNLSTHLDSLDSLAVTFEGVQIASVLFIGPDHFRATMNDGRSFEAPRIEWIMAALDRQNARDRLRRARAGYVAPKSSEAAGDAPQP